MRIFVLCPSRLVTGGPEALHQLCDALNARGADAQMVYVRKRKRWRVRRKGGGILDLRIRRERGFAHDPAMRMPAAYSHYGIKLAAEFNPTAEDYVVIPEAAMHFLPLVGEATPIIWWLSVDNIAGGFSEILELRNGRALHYVQSRFAADVAHALGFEVSGLLTDYISRSHSDMHRAEGERNGVAYNPRKGLPYLEKLRPHLAGVPLHPIDKMTPRQVAQLLRSVRVYLDVGDHPGRDRLPREAALAGAVVISSEIGGASRQEDMPVGDEFKFSKKNETLEGVAQKVRAAIARFDEASANQDGYRHWVRGQQVEFGRQVDAMLGRLSSL